MEKINSDDVVYVKETKEEEPIVVKYARTGDCVKCGNCCPPATDRLIMEVIHFDGSLSALRALTRLNKPFPELPKPNDLLQQQDGTTLAYYVKDQNIGCFLVAYETAVALYEYAKDLCNKKAPSMSVALGAIAIINQPHSDKIPVFSCQFLKEPELIKGKEVRECLHFLDHSKLETEDGATREIYLGSIGRPVLCQLVPLGPGDVQAYNCKGYTYREC